MDGDWNRLPPPASVELCVVCFTQSTNDENSSSSDFWIFLASHADRRHSDTKAPPGSRGRRTAVGMLNRFSPRPAFGLPFLYVTSSDFTFSRPVTRLGITRVKIGLQKYRASSSKSSSRVESIGVAGAGRFRSYRFRNACGSERPPILAGGTQKQEGRT